MTTFADKVIQFYFSLWPNFKLPSGIGLLNPFEVKSTRKAFAEFYQKYYNDNHQRISIFGINPGRFGAGLTGVSFTDPIRLELNCGIKNELKKKPELSSLFVYQVIDAYGGVENFYKDFYVTAISPLGFTEDGNNLNYYDYKNLTAAVNPFIIDSIKKQMDFGLSKNISICLGEGSNYKYFSKINEEHKFFKKIIPLSHPRWVMQYRRKKADEYVKKYVEVLKNI